MVFAQILLRCFSKTYLYVVLLRLLLLLLFNTCLTSYETEEAVSCIASLLFLRNFCVGNIIGLNLWKGSALEKELLQDPSGMCREVLRAWTGGWITSNIIMHLTWAIERQVLTMLAVAGELHSIADRVGLILGANSCIYDMGSRVNFIQSYLVIFRLLCFSLVTVDYGNDCRTCEWLINLLIINFFLLLDSILVTALGLTYHFCC